MFKRCIFLLVLAGCTTQVDTAQDELHQNKTTPAADAVTAKVSSNFESQCFSLTGQRINLSEQDSRFVPLYVPQPYYPSNAERFGKVGYVIVAVDIIKGGVVENVRVLESCPKKLFDRSALEAGAKLRYGIEPDGVRLEKIRGAMYKFTYAGYSNASGLHRYH